MKKEEELFRSKVENDASVRPLLMREPKAQYLLLDDIIKMLYKNLFVFAVNNDFNELFENSFISAFTSISSRLIYYINLEL